MATKIWTGNALATTHQVSLTPGGTIEAGDLFKATLNGKTLSVAAPDTTVAALCLAFAAAWAALDSTVYPEFSEILATVDDPVTPTKVLLTALNPGIPFTVSSATTEAGGGAADAQTWAQSTVTTATGPYHWDATANWEGGVAPVSTDDVIIDVPAADIRYGLPGSILDLATLTVRGNVRIGLPRFSDSGYANYLPQSLKVSGRIQIDTTGGLVKLDLGSGDSAKVQVDGAGQADEADAAVQIVGGAGSGWEVRRNAGSIGIAVHPGEVAELDLVAVGGEGNEEGSPVTIGAGATVSDFRQSAGTVRLYAGVDNIGVVTGGILNILGDADCDIVEFRGYGGETNWYAPGTITTLKASVPIQRKGHQPCTITNSTLTNPDAFPVDENGTITFTNPVVLPPEGVNAVKVGTNVRLAVTRV